MHAIQLPFFQNSSLSFNLFNKSTHVLTLRQSEYSISRACANSPFISCSLQKQKYKTLTMRENIQIGLYDVLFVQVQAWTQRKVARTGVNDINQKSGQASIYVNKVNEATRDWSLCGLRFLVQRFYAILTHFFYLLDIFMKRFPNKRFQLKTLEMYLRDGTSSLNPSPFLAFAVINFKIWRDYSFKLFAISLHIFGITASVYSISLLTLHLKINSKQSEC